MRSFSILLFVIAIVLLSLAPAHSLHAVAQDATPAATSVAPGEPVTLNGADIYYEVHGLGEPVVLLHGGLAHGGSFANQVPALISAGYQVILIDSRGHGRSSHGPEPLSYELMASDVLGVLDHLGVDKANILGWSDGAIIGLELAINHPERLNKLVAYGANYTPEGFHEATPTPELDAFLGPLFEQIVADYQRLSPDPEGFAALAEELGALYQVAPNFREEQLRSITVPTLILDGAEEEFIDLDQPRRMAELIPGAQLILMPGTGHFAPVQQPEEFNRIVLEFLQT